MNGLHFCVQTCRGMTKEAGNVVEIRPELDQNQKMDLPPPFLVCEHLLRHWRHPVSKEKFHWDTEIMI